MKGRDVMALTTLIKLRPNQESDINGNSYPDSFTVFDYDLVKVTVKDEAAGPWIEVVGINPNDNCTEVEEGAISLTDVEEIDFLCEQLKKILTEAVEKAGPI
jgi:hypothetical protein